MITKMQRYPCAGNWGARTAFFGVLAGGASTSAQGGVQGALHSSCQWVWGWEMTHDDIIHSAAQSCGLAKAGFISSGFPSPGRDV